MRKRRAFLICMVHVIGIIVLLMWQSGVDGQRVPMSVAYSDEVLGIAIVENLDFLGERELQKTESNPGVLFENTLLPYDAESNTLFLSQSMDTQKWVGELVGEGDFFLCTTQDAYWQKKQDAIRDGYAFGIWLVNEESYYELKLVVSGMPTISIDTESKERIQDGEELQGIIRVFDPDIGSGRFEIHESYVTYHIKGNTSRRFEKKGYALKLQDYQGQKVDASLLGMRSDNSWKLNPLYTDNNRIREKTAAQIWEKFSEANTELKQDGPRLEYVEVVINNEYEGVYCLVEPVDEDKLGLDKNDVLYKVVSWNVPSSDDFVTAVADKASTAAGIRINYPKTITNHTDVWYPMWDYSQRFYFNPELDYEKALSTVKVENLSDIFMFLMVTSASDNSYKNLYFAAEVTENNEYVMKQIPWDLDYTFGNVYDGESENLTRFAEYYQSIYADSTLPRLKFENIEEIGSAFLERWNQYRNTFLNTESILCLLRENRDYLVETGAMKRERERWQEIPVSSDIDQLLQYQENRMAWLDIYFLEWATN